jgi:aminocarboxymuconate-semialdehyde decarboxylase
MIPGAGPSRAGPGALRLGVEPRFGVAPAVFGERAPRLLAGTLGEDHVMLGSDLPYPQGESPSGSLISKAGFLTSVARAKLLSANAEAVLG